MLTQERLKEVLHYDPDTGVFTRVKARSHNAAGGTINKATGYRYIHIDGAQYLAHRLAFLYMTGAWPKNQVDHIDGHRLNNRWSNLRDATPTINQQNLRKAQSNNAHGLLGVTELKNRRGTKKFSAQLFANGKRRYFSYHYTAEEAHQAYLAAKRQLHEGNTL